MSRCPVCDHEVHVMGHRNVVRFDWKEIRVEMAEVERLAVLDAANNLREWAKEIDHQWHDEAWTKAGIIDECADRLEARAKEISAELNE